jgi:E3 ubiquitin-protein ligase RNF5
MPAQTRKRRATNEALESVTSDSSVPSTNRSNKRRATQTTTAAASSTQQQPSASSSWRPPRVKTPAAAASRPKRETRETPITFDSDIDEEEEEIIDLVDKDEVPPLEDDKPKEPKEDNTVKLGSFQCVICMDDVTGLTVTHCGMFVFLILYIVTLFKRNTLTSMLIHRPPLLLRMPPRRAAH